jgi:hypothetical protein
LSRPVNDASTSRDYLRAGWRAVRPAWGRVLLVFLVWALLTNAAALACFLPLLVVGGPLTGGLYLFLARLLNGKAAEIGDLFLGFRRFVPTTIVYLVATVAWFAVLLVLWAPVAAADAAGLIETEDFETMPLAAQVVLGPYALLIFVLASVATLLIFTFGMPAAMFGGERGALRDAARLTRRHFRRVLGLNLAGAALVVLASVVGVLLCVVGVLVLQPLAIATVIVAHVALYRAVAGPPTEGLLYTDRVLGGS